MIAATTMKHKMGAVLMSDAAQKINFYLDGLHVDGSGLSYVALALLSKATFNSGFNVRVGGMGAGAEATYQPKTNTFTFPSVNYGDTPFQRMTMLHECVHALRDAYGVHLNTSLGPVKTFSLSDEAAAYLAGAIFYMYDNNTAVRPAFAQNVAVYGAAHDLAVKVFNSAGFAVNPTDAKILKDAIVANPAYSGIKNNPKQTYANNGVRL